MGEGARLRAADGSRFAWRCSRFVPAPPGLCSVSDALSSKSPGPRPSVESVSVSLGTARIVTGMARGVNHAAPITIVEADCFSSSCQQEFSGFFFFKSHPPTYKVYGLKCKFHCILN